MGGHPVYIFCFQSARHNDVEKLKKLLKQYDGNPLKINSLNKERLSALHYAVRYGHLTCMREIIRAEKTSQYYNK